MKDEILIDQYLRGNEEAFEMLMARYEKRIFSYVNSMVNNTDDARDITQKTFIKAFRKVSRLKDKARFRNWLYKIAVNQTRDFFRNRWDEAPVEEHDIPSENPSPERSAINRDLLLKARRCIVSLPLRQREVLILKVFHGMTFPEIAELLGGKPETMRANFHFGMKTLRSRLREGGVGYEM